MKLIIILTILAGLFFGYWLSLDPGYVLLSWYQYTFESSLWLFLVALFLLFFTILIITNLSIFIIQKGFRFKHWRKNNKRASAQEDTRIGLLYLANGQWDKAERMLTRSAQHLKTPLINYLSASRAAQEKSDFEAAQQWLEKATQTSKSSEQLAVGMAKAELLFSRGHFEQSLAVLLELQKNNPVHTHVLKLLIKVYKELEEWSALYELLPIVRKHIQITNEELDELEDKIYIQLLERKAKEDKQNNNNKELKVKRFFNSLSRGERHSMPVLRCYLKLLIELKKEDLAEEELRTALKHIWNDELVELYGQLKGENSKAQYLFAQQQLKERPNDPILLLTVARLALKHNNLKKARAYTETGLRIRSLPSLQAEMGKILILEGNKAAACDYLLKSVEAK